MLEHLPSGSPFASDSLHMNQVYTGQQGGYCTEICDDPIFDKLVLESAQEMDYAKYSFGAFFSFGTDYYNCQAWARAVLDKAKEKYMSQASEKCEKCNFGWW